MSVPLYCDECLDRRVIEGLRRRDVNIVTAADEGLLGASDEEHFARAVALDRVIVTNDHDFLRLAVARIETASDFPGVIFVHAATRVGDAITGIFLLATISGPADLANRIEWVP